MNYLRRTPFLLGFVPLNITNPDKISKDLKTTKDVQYQTGTETGMDRIKQMFQVDEFGGLSTELNSIYQAGFLGFLVGAIYGGVINSRNAYVNFMENNEATAFKSHLDAKRKLQDQFTLSFAKGAFKWGWRLGIFTTLYTGITTCIAVYREKSSIYEYLIAGFTTGSLYKMNLGIRGMTVGGLLGGCLGGTAGVISLLILKTTGTSMEEIRYWQYKWKLNRDFAEKESLDAQYNKKSEIMMIHDDRVGEEKGLENIK